MKHIVQYNEELYNDDDVIEQYNEYEQQLKRESYLIDNDYSNYVSVDSDYEDGI